MTAGSIPWRLDAARKKLVMKIVYYSDFFLYIIACAPEAKKLPTYEIPRVNPAINLREIPLSVQVRRQDYTVWQKAFSKYL